MELTRNDRFRNVRILHVSEQRRSERSRAGRMTGADHAQAMNAINKKDWETPDWLVRGVERIWGITFTLDAAANAANAKAPLYLDSAADSMNPKTKWGNLEKVWLNPPYGEWEIPAFLYRAQLALADNEADLVCFLIPNATENDAWYEYIFPYAAEICFIKGRISFEAHGRAIQGNTRGSVLIFFKRQHSGGPKLSWINRDTLRGDSEPHVRGSRVTL